MCSCQGDNICLSQQESDGEKKSKQEAANERVS
jgi:hypothetical protein